MDDIIKLKKQRNIEKKDSIFSKILPVVLIIISIFLLYNVSKSYIITQEKIKILDQAHEEVEKLRVKNIQLVLERETLENIGYLEKEIRNRLNYAKKGETVIVISDIVYNKSKNRLEEIINNQDKEEIQAGIKVWVNFLFNL